MTTNETILNAAEAIMRECESRNVNDPSYRAIVRSVVIKRDRRRGTVAVRAVGTFARNIESATGAAIPARIR